MGSGERRLGALVVPDVEAAAEVIAAGAGGTGAAGGRADTVAEVVAADVSRWDLPNIARDIIQCTLFTTHFCEFSSTL